MTELNPLKSVEPPDKLNLRHLFKLGEYHMTMGLRILDKTNWLTMDNNYVDEHYLRAELLTKSKNQVFQCFQGSEDACMEALEVVLGFLTETWPGVFKCFGANNDFIHNNKTSEDFQLGVFPPLEIAARLVMEDLNILKEFDGCYIL
jgi:hypothetical protein